MEHLKVSFQPNESAWILFLRAYVLQMQGDLLEAIKGYRRSIKLHPTAEAYTYLGQTYRQQQRLDLALKYCRRAIAVDPEFANAHDEIGLCLLLRHQPKAAIESLERALAARRGDARHASHLHLGLAWEALYQPGKAIACYRRTLRLEPKCEKAGLRLMHLLGQTN